MPRAPQPDGPPSQLSLPHAKASVAEARREVVGALEGLGVPAQVLDDVALVVSELVTNALRHARPLPGGWIEVAWQVQQPHVRLWVRDGGGPTRPQATHVGASALGGRGLGIVGTVAEMWGVEQQPAGTTVWAELSADPARHLAGAGLGLLV